MLQKMQEGNRVARERAVKIIIPGEPVAWKRAGVNSRGWKPKFYDRQLDVKSQIRAWFMHALTNYYSGDNSSSREHLLAGSYDVRISLYFSAPSHLSRIELNILSWGLLDMNKKPDADNCVKLVNDAGNKILWNDDAEIVSLYIKKMYCKDGNPRTEIEIMPRNQKSKSVKILSEVAMQDIDAFCKDALCLQNAMQAFIDDTSDDVSAASIAYWISKIADQHGSWIKKVEKHKKLWQEIEAEVTVSRYYEGKPLC